MNALNLLILETLGVSLNTVRAAYGRARNTSINVKSTASEKGRLPVSSSKLPSAILISDDLILDGMDEAVALFEKPRKGSERRRWFDSPFDDDAQPDGLPMAIFSKHKLDSGETVSDWHRLRNEFWSIARTDSVIMERYKHDVLG